MSVAIYDGNIPDCTAQRCEEAQAAINQVCKANAWPAGHKVLLVTSEGNACYCHCGGNPPASVSDDD